MKVLIFGGTGSIGNSLISSYYDEVNLYVVSRDEMKQWEMKIKFPKVNFIIGDIRDRVRILSVLSQVDPDIIIIAAAMKHIDRCEVEINECISTNIDGLQNILSSLNPSVKTVCFISTDKACDPVSVYGMSKGIGEALMVSMSKKHPAKFVCVRYGNVLNSRGSIIPTLHEIGKNGRVFTLTHEGMTRLIMTADESVDIIRRAVENGDSGDIVLPELRTIKIKDLIEIFSEKYNKPIEIVGLRPGERLFENLINSTQVMRLVKDDKYLYIKREPVSNVVAVSQETLLSKDNLRELLISQNII
jgi:UDP-N-acetylglucosamine 4,6-dehydratase/5-epimerase